MCLITIISQHHFAFRRTICRPIPSFLMMAKASRCSEGEGFIHQLEGDVTDQYGSLPSGQYRPSVIDQGIDEDSASLSGSARNSMGPDEAVFDLPTRTSSPQTSNASDDEISILEDCYTTSQQASGRFTPLKQRSPFRNPSSVRAMQLDTTPPHLTGSPSQGERHKIPPHSRQTSTPRSARSSRSHRGTPSRIMNSSPTKLVRKEHPLVLLHVTLLPLAYQYPTPILESVLPPTILANWELLKEKTTRTVLHRGVLIPHPREDYELLEERLLEALELKQPRILKCGHFHLSAEEVAEIEAYGANESEEDEETGCANNMDMCPDCGRRIRNGSFGNAGSGSKRWDVKVFAANGLMRAGAWAAAWREMERVDVEILPWMEESMRRELEARHEEEELTRREEEKERREEGVAGLDDERLKEIYGQETQSFIDGLENDVDSPGTKRMANNRLDQSPPPISQDQNHRHQEIPLGDLLRNYIYVLAQDRRNLVILLLSLFVLFLSTRSNLPTSAIALPSYQTVADPVAPTIISTAVDSTKKVMSPEITAENSEIPTAEPSQEPDAIKQDTIKNVDSNEIVNDAATEDFESDIHGPAVDKTSMAETV